jgi:hypothetical protein
LTVPLHRLLANLFHREDCRRRGQQEEVHPTHQSVSHLPQLAQPILPAESIHRRKPLTSQHNPAHRFVHLGFMPSRKLTHSCRPFGHPGTVIQQLCRRCQGRIIKGNRLAT